MTRTHVSCDYWNSIRRYKFLGRHPDLSFYSRIAPFVNHLHVGKVNAKDFCRIMTTFPNLWNLSVYAYDSAVLEAIPEGLQKLRLILGDLLSVNLTRLFQRLNATLTTLDLYRCACSQSPRYLDVAGLLELHNVRDLRYMRPSLGRAFPFLQVNVHQLTKLKLHLGLLNSPQRVYEPQVWQLIWQMVNLQSLTMKSVSFQQPILLDNAIAPMAMLKELRIENWTGLHDLLTTVDLPALTLLEFTGDVDIVGGDVFTRLTRLKKLSLLRGPLSDPTLSWNISIPAIFVLTELKVLRFDSVYDEGDILKLVMGLPKLKELDTRCIEKSGHSVEELKSYLKRNNRRFIHKNP